MLNCNNETSSGSSDSPVHCVCNKELKNFAAPQLNGKPLALAQGWC